MICAYRHWGNKEDVIREPIKTLLSYYTKFHEEVETHPELDDEARETLRKTGTGRKGRSGAVAVVQRRDPERVQPGLRHAGHIVRLLQGESFYSDKMPRIVRKLEEKGLLKESKGAHVSRSRAVRHGSCPHNRIGRLIAVHHQRYSGCRLRKEHLRLLQEYICRRIAAEPPLPTVVKDNRTSRLRLGQRLTSTCLSDW